MFNSIFKIVYFVEFIVISIIRKKFTKRLTNEKITIDKKTGLDIFFLVINGIGMIIPILYVLTSRLDFANYYLPDWIGWIGSLLFIDAMWILYKSHADLGRQWTATVGMREGHQLVTSGIYKYIRHPMYAAHILWALAQVMMLHNWIAGYSFIVVMVPFYIYRVTKEEEMLMETFGEEYEKYRNKTGALFPKLF